MTIRSYGLATLFLVFFSSISVVNAQTSRSVFDKLKSKDSNDVNKAPGMFTEYSLFGVQSKANDEPNGAALGARLAFYYGDDEDIPQGKNSIGFYGATAAIEAGYGGWIPYEFSVGAAGGVQFRNRIAVGFQYNMLAIYGYSEQAYGGSGFKLKARYDRVTVGLGRDGIGFFTGAFRDRDFSATHVELKADLYKQWGIGFKHTWLDRGNPTFKVGENRIFIGLVF
jgi:hypothetical protein